MGKSSDAFGEDMTRRAEYLEGLFDQVQPAKPQAEVPAVLVERQGRWCVCGHRHFGRRWCPLCACRKELVDVG